MTNLKPCPFCGSKIRIVVCDDEGNTHNDDYENDPWSGLGYQLYHDITDDPNEKCPIAGHEGEGVMGIWIYDSREEAIEAWNRRGLTMKENDATELVYKNGYNKGLVYGACGFCGYLITKADEKGIVHYCDLADLAREYTDILKEKEVNS